MTSASAMLIKVRRMVTWTPAQSCGDQVKRSSTVCDKAYSRPWDTVCGTGYRARPAAIRCRPGCLRLPEMLDQEQCDLGTSSIAGDQGLRKKSVGVRPHLVKILATVPSSFISAYVV